MGSTQVNKLGEIETPILLTSTLAVPRTADGVIDYMLSLPGNEDVRAQLGDCQQSDGGSIESQRISYQFVFSEAGGATSISVCNCRPCLKRSNGYGKAITRAASSRHTLAWPSTSKGRSARY